MSNDRITGIASLLPQRRRWAASSRASFAKRSLWVGLEIIQPYGGGLLPPLWFSQAYSAAGPRPSRTWVMTATAQNPSSRAFFVKRSLWVGLEIIQPYGGGSLPPLRHCQAHSAAGPRPSRTWVMTATAQNPSSRAFFAKRSPWAFPSGVCNMFQLPRLLRCARKDVSGKASSRASVAK